jgi:hypothetical protein
VAEVKARIGYLNKLVSLVRGTVYSDYCKFLKGKGSNIRLN